MVGYVNPTAWFSQRQLDHCPPHFSIMTRPLTPESKQWVFDTLVGRFSIVEDRKVVHDVIVFISTNVYFAFEDPNEAILYILKW